MAAVACARLFICRVTARVSFNQPRLCQDVRGLVTSNFCCQALEPPKRPVTSFLYFLSVKRNEIRTNNPGSSVTDQGKIAGQLWRGLDQSEKEKFKLLAGEHFEEYKEQYQKYLHNLTDKEKLEIKEGRKQKQKRLMTRRLRKVKKSLGIPARPRNPFSLFVKASSSGRGDRTIQQYFKELADQWRVMPEGEKQIYEHDAVIDRERYDIEMSAWEDKMKTIGREDVIRRTSRTKGPRKLRVVAKTKKVAKKPKAKRKRKSTKPKMVSKSVQTDPEE